MKPYYQDDMVTLYHANCLEALPRLAGNVTITDPPYNAGKQYGQHDDSMEDGEYLAWLAKVMKACGKVTPEIVYFPGTRNLLKTHKVIRPPFRPVRVLAWHKKEFAGDKWKYGPAMCWEPIIWASSLEAPRFNRIFGTNGRDYLVVNSTHGDPFAKLHPCPKPMPVMRWLVSLFAPEEGIVIDPFAGTGTTLRAAKDLGRKAIGVEQEERYCELAVSRLAQGTFDFGPPPETFTQPSLLTD